MGQSITTAILIVLSSLFTWQVTSASARWRRGRGLLRRPAVVETENMERMWRARTDRARGWREVLRAVGQWMVALVLVFVLAWLWGGTNGW